MRERLPHLPQHTPQITLHLFKRMERLKRLRSKTSVLALKVSYLMSNIFLRITNTKKEDSTAKIVNQIS
jgi:L-rhamnose isomerase